MRRTVTAAVAVLGCVLAGCGGDAESDDSAASPSSSASPTDTSASSTDTAEPSGDSSTPGDGTSGGDGGGAPPLPDAARKNTLKGAEAFIRHYIDLLNYASDTGEISDLRAAAKNCEGCRTYEKLYRKTYVRGGFIRSEGWKVTSAHTFDQDDAVVALVTVDAPRMRFQRSADSAQKIGRGGTYKLKFELSPDGAAWVVTYFGVQPRLPEHS